MNHTPTKKKKKNSRIKEYKKLLAEYNDSARWLGHPICIYFQLHFFSSFSSVFESVPGNLAAQ